MKRYISLLLAALMLLTLAPLDAFAASDMKASDAVKLTIKNYEGIKLTAYKLSGETYWTIGYGHTDSTIYEGMTITQEEADAYFEEDIAVFEDAVNGWNDAYGLNLTQQQFDALVSITYNFGAYWVTSYKSWRLSKYIKNNFADSSGNTIDPLELADSFGVLCHSSGTVLTGLIERRINEAEMFLYGDYSTNNLYFTYEEATDGSTFSNGNDVRILWKDGYVEPTNSYGEADPDEPDESSCKYGDNCPSKAFDDAPDVGHWAHDAIDDMINRSLFNGTDNGFEPYRVTTRSMLVTVLYRLEGSPSVDGYTESFADVDEDVWYYDALLWASNANIANGALKTENGEEVRVFMPDDELTREQLATLLCRYANYKGYDVDEVDADLSKYTDRSSISEWARESMCWAVGWGLMEGTSMTTLSPNGSATRAEVCTILYRFTGNM